MPGVTGAPWVHFLQADLLTGLKPIAVFALLVANLPYVPRAEWERLPREIGVLNRPAPYWGAKTAWTSSGLWYGRRNVIKGGGWVLLEVGDQQAALVTALVEATGAYDRIETIKDFSGMERVVQARRRDGTG